MDFARVLLVGVVILAVMLILFGGGLTGFGGAPEGGPGYQFGPVQTPQEEEKPEKAKEEKVPESAFFVGKKKKTDYKYFTLSSDPFSVSFKEEKLPLGKLNETTLKKGFMADKSKIVTFNLTKEQRNKIRSLHLHFYVEDTNSFGRLLMDLNGDRVYSNFPKPGRSYSVKVNESLLKKRNVLRVHVESSGTKFWAPTTYILKNFTAEAKILGRRMKSFTFSLTKEQANNFESGRLILHPKDFNPNDPLIIQVNGRDVYRERTTMPGRPFLWINFEDAELRKGSNEITFSTYYNSSYKFKSAEFIYFWISGAENVTSKTLSVSSSQYGRLPGEISFTIDKIEKSPTSLNLNIVTPEGEENKIIIQKVLKEGKNISIDLTKDDIAEGENELQFIVEGKGGFYLSNFDVNY